LAKALRFTGLFYPLHLSDHPRLRNAYVCPLDCSKSLHISSTYPIGRTPLGLFYAYKVGAMALLKLAAGERAGTYVIESPVTEDEIFDIARSLAMKRFSRGATLGDPRKVFDYLQALLTHEEREVFALMLLDTGHRVIAFEQIFQGTLDAANVYPREVVKTVLRHNAAAVILVHNHPSGNPEPSRADRELTQTLKKLLNLVGTRTLDHIVVGREGCVSMAEKGLM
jgi:DNA repair protein RadC